MSEQQNSNLKILLEIIMIMIIHFLDVPLEFTQSKIDLNKFRQSGICIILYIKKHDSLSDVATLSNYGGRITDAGSVNCLGKHLIQIVQ